MINQEGTKPSTAFFGGGGLSVHLLFVSSLQLIDLNINSRDGHEQFINQNHHKLCLRSKKILKPYET